MSFLYHSLRFTPLFQILFEFFRFMKNSSGVNPIWNKTVGSNNLPIHSLYCHKIFLLIVKIHIFLYKKKFQSSNRRLSSDKALMSSTENLGKFPARKGSRKLKLSESIASSIGSNLNRIGGAQDLTKMLLTDDYFSDVNPRSMRRLMNVVYVSGK